MSEQPTVLYEVANRVALITLNRPERGNAITPALITELSECVRQADLNPAVHVLLLAGAGPVSSTSKASSSESSHSTPPATISPSHDPRLSRISRDTCPGSPETSQEADEGIRTLDLRHGKATL